MKKRLKEEFKMMDFVLMTISFTMAILLAGGLSIMILMNKRVLKWYMKKVEKMTNELFEMSLENKTEDL